MPKQVRNGLTVRKVETLPNGLHCDGNNLYLQVHGVSRVWVFRYKSPVTGAMRHMGLGSAELVTLAEARDKAHTLRRKIVLDRVDPLAEKRVAAAQKALERPIRSRAPTFAECAKACLMERQKGTGARYRQDSARKLEQHVYPLIGERRVDAISRNDIADVLQPMWTTKHVTAGKVQVLMSTVFKFAVFKGYRPDDPAQWKHGLDNVLAKPTAVHEVRHREAMEVADIPAFMAQLHAQIGTYPRAVEWTILTAARSDMTRKAQWSEIDMSRKIWTIPKSRMKTRRDFRVPLSTTAWGIVELQAKTRRNDLLFPGDYGDVMGIYAQLRVVKLVSASDALTVHGFRSTFRTWAQESASWNRETIETAMAHAVHDATEKAYARGDVLDARRALMQAWDDYCRT